MHSVFAALGRLVVRRPYLIMVLSVACALGCGAGLFAGTWETHLERLYVPRQSESYRALERQQALFGRAPRVAEFLATATDGSSMLLKRNLLAVLDLHTHVATSLAAASENGTEVTFPDVCERAYEGGPCLVDNALERLGLAKEASWLADLDQETIDAFLSENEAVREYAGHVRETPGGAVEYAGSLRFFYFVSQPGDPGPRPLFGGEDEALAAREAWEAQFLEEVVGDQPALNLTVRAIAARSLDDEVARNVEGSAPFMAVSLVSILVYLAVSIGGRPCVRSRLGLGVSAVATVALAIVAGFGATCAVGVTLSDLALMICFVVIGIAVDDVFIIVSYLDDQPAWLPLEDRMARALGAAGSAILVTSATNLAAFLASAAVPGLPAVRAFCVAAGLVIFVLFGLTTTFFAATLALDERRRGQGRLDCLCCLPPPRGAPRGSPPAAKQAALAVPPPPTLAAVSPVRAPRAPSFVSTGKGEAQRVAVTISASAKGVAVRLAPRPESEAADAPTDKSVAETSAPPKRCWLTAYAKWICRPAVSIPVALAVAALIPLGAQASGRLAIGVQLADNFPDGSPLAAYYVEVEEAFGTMASETALIAEGVDWADDGVQGQVESLVDGVNALEDVASPFRSWLADYHAWAKARGLPAAGPGFCKAARAFLADEEVLCADGPDCERRVVPRMYSRHVALAPPGHGCAGAARIVGKIRAGDTLEGRVHVMDRFRSAVGGLRGDLDVVSWTYFFMFSDRDKLVTRLVVGTLISAAAAVLCVLALFLPVPAVAAVATAVAAVDGGLFAMMWAWSVPLDVASVICLAMAVGMSVDFVTHVAIAHDRAPGAPAARVAASLCEVGRPVLRSGATTLLGFAVLGLTTSAIFRMFFKMLVSTVILSLIVGLAFFPACASWGLVGGGGKAAGPDKAADASALPADVEAASSTSSVSDPPSSRDEPGVGPPPPTPPSP